ncbi:MAG: CopG family transcriptional regulator [Acidovorax sp.]|uniref:CopG family transcriptional regulator n=1 Tax=Acidovorax sp. TaxID=1872122 RepID=UPI0039E28BA1
MSRLTITLSEPRYRALKEAAARRGKAIGVLIDESLEFYGIKTREDALDIFARAGQHSSLRPEEAQELATQEVRAHRNEKPSRH